MATRRRHANGRQTDARGKPRRIDPLLEARRRFKALLALLRLTSAFERMPPYVRDQVFDARFPEPLLQFDASCASDAEGMRFRATLEQAFGRAVADLVHEPGGHRVTLNVRDFWSFLYGMDALVDSIGRGPGAASGRREFPTSVREFAERAKPAIAAVLSQQSATLTALHEAVILPLVARSRLDARLWQARCAVEPGHRRRPRLVMTVAAEPAQQCRVTLDGHERPAYRVGTCNEWNAVRWLDWDPGLIAEATPARHAGADGADAPPGGPALPVYVQSHALRQLRERVNLPTFAPWVEYWLYESLREPTIVDRQPGGDLLVAYRVQDDRMGYLVVTPLGDRVVVRTFLFLTMAPSPEARQLARRLRLSRRDVDWLGLHELAAFTQSDLRDDETLYALLAECGCGHLFELADEAFNPLPRPLAATMKQYLGMAA